MASQSLKNTFWVKNFLFTKVALGYFGTTWGILHRTSTKKYRRIEASPMALWALHFFGNGRPTQPCHIYAHGNAMNTHVCKCLPSHVCVCRSIGACPLACPLLYTPCAPLQYSIAIQHHMRRGAAPPAYQHCHTGPCSWRSALAAPVL